MSNLNMVKAVNAPSSLSQGGQFAAMTAAYHGGRRHRMRGGAASYPDQFGDVLPNDMRAAADIGKLDAGMAELPSFAGKYGMAGGRRTRKMRGGVAEINAPAMILSQQEAAAAMLHPQWTNENLVVPGYKGPDNALVQKAGRRKASRKNRKASRNNRKASRKNRKASRKNRKASRKNRKASRKNRKASRKNRKASRKNRKASRKNRKASRKNRK
jgi:hypothetical protein